MRLLFSSFTFVLTLAVGAVAFAATAIEYPTLMRQLISWAQLLPPYLSQVGLSDTYLVWTDILLSGDKLVLMGFVIVTRLVFALIGMIFGPLFGMGPAQAGGDSAFNRWGG
jgi:hypothetical protein